MLAGPHQKCQAITLSSEDWQAWTAMLPTGKWEATETASKRV